MDAKSFSAGVIFGLRQAEWMARTRENVLGYPQERKQEAMHLRCAISNRRIEYENIYKETYKEEP